MKIQIRTELPDGAPLAVRVRDVVDHWSHGATTYYASASRVSGAFTLRFTARPWALCDEIDTPHVDVMYGRTSDGRDDPFDRHRADLPVVNGVRLTGGAIINTETLRERRLTRRDVNVRRSTGPHTTAEAPDATQDRTAAVVSALLTHWLTRGTVTLAHRITAARYRADERRAEYERDRQRQRERIAEARQILADLDERDAAAERIMAAPPAVR